MSFLRLVYFWPGAARLWYRGQIDSLATSLLFASILNLLLLATFIWPEWLAKWLVGIGWLGIGIAVSGTLVRSLLVPVIPRSGLTKGEADRWLVTAQQDYLRGDYIAAEASLHRILSSGSEDPEAVLLLASVLRRSGRVRQARDCLERLSRLDTAAAWLVEIAAEERKCGSQAALDS